MLCDGSRRGGGGRGVGEEGWRSGWGGGGYICVAMVGGAGGRIGVLCLL